MARIIFHLNWWSGIEPTSVELHPLEEPFNGTLPSELQQQRLLEKGKLNKIISAVLSY